MFGDGPRRPGILTPESIAITTTATAAPNARTPFHPLLVCSHETRSAADFSRQKRSCFANASFCVGRFVVRDVCAPTCAYLPIFVRHIVSPFPSRSSFFANFSAILVRSSWFPRWGLARPARISFRCIKRYTAHFCELQQRSIFNYGQCFCLPFIPSRVGISV